MSEVINERVNIITIYDSLKGSVMPVKLQWRGREYKINKLGYHHKVRQGRTLLHVFSVSNETTAFKLQFNTDTLEWFLQEIYDESAHQ